MSKISWLEALPILSRIVTKVGPPLLEALDAGATPVVAATAVLGKLSKDGLGVVSAQTFEHITMATASLYYDLRVAGETREAAKKREEAAVPAATEVRTVVNLRNLLSRPRP